MEKLRGQTRAQLREKQRKALMGQPMRALVVDGNQTARAILVSMLRDYGVAQVHQASRILDARRMLETEAFDFVICESEFAGSVATGQDFLSDLRRTGALPFGTVFIMVTGEASYSRVAEAAETALDSYLLKPHTPTALNERLTMARTRKIELCEIFAALEEGDHNTAAQLCIDRLASRGKYWLYAARIGAELLLRLDRPRDAQAMFDAVFAAKALPWAKLGVARAQVDLGDVAAAQSVVERLIDQNDRYADAYDVLGRMQIERGDFNAALATYGQALRITPACVTRLQKYGTLAFFCGETDLAWETLTRAVALGSGSRTLDAQVFVLLGLLALDRADRRSMAHYHQALVSVRQQHPESLRLKRMQLLISACDALLRKHLSEAIELIKTAAQARREDSFEIESACSLLSALARMRKTEIQLPDAVQWVQDVARRFCASGPLTDLLLRAAAPAAEYVEIVRASHRYLDGLGEQAMARTKEGHAQEAIKSLIVAGGSTQNSRIVDLALLLATRHKATLPDAEQTLALLVQMRHKLGQRTVILGRPDRIERGLVAPVR